MDFNFDNALTNSLQEVDKKVYKTDDRFYVLKKDEQKNGAALIRFLPSELFEDGTMSTVKKVYKYNVRSKTGKAFIAEWSPSTIGKSDPIQEKWQKLWNAGQQEEARRYARSERYIANIKIINDTKVPENNGKIFLLDMSKTLYEKIKGIMEPTAQDIALGKKAKNLFNPVNGYNFLLIAKEGANGMVTYNDSDAAQDANSIYANIDEAVKEIKEKCYKLSDWDKEEAYPTYEFLKSELDRIDNNQSQKVETIETTQAPAQTASFVAQEVSTQTSQAPAAGASSTNDLDALINSLGK